VGSIASEGSSISLFIPSFSLSESLIASDIGVARI
jgi:hypothetical protein